MVINFRQPKYVEMDGKRYKITGKTETNDMAVAEFHAVTSKKDYGWKPVQNVTIRSKLYKKL